MLLTYFTRDWGFRYPIIGAPMANSGLGRLAHAVTAAGGLGMFGVGNRDGVALIEREAAIAGAGGARFGIGLMVWKLVENPELLDAAIAQRPYMLSISFGSVRPYVDQVHRAGILLATQVHSRAAAIQAQQDGADLIVAQGHEAGGHTGFIGTLPLLQIVLESVRVPVAAAGGIATPAGVAAVLAAGACAAWIGTAFLLAPESAVPEAAKARIQAAPETATIHTQVFDRVNRLGWPPEFPGRALRNEFAEKWNGREHDLLADPAEQARFRRAADAKDYDVTSIYAGQSVGLVNHPRSAADTVRWLAEGAEALLKRRLYS